MLRALASPPAWPSETSAGYHARSNGPHNTRRSNTVTWRPRTTCTPERKTHRCSAPRPRRYGRAAAHPTLLEPHRAHEPPIPLTLDPISGTPSVRPARSTATSAPARVVWTWSKGTPGEVVDLEQQRGERWRGHAAKPYAADDSQPYPRAKPGSARIPPIPGPHPAPLWRALETRHVSCLGCRPLHNIWRAIQADGGASLPSALQHGHHLREDIARGLVVRRAHGPHPIREGCERLGRAADKDTEEPEALHPQIPFIGASAPSLGPQSSQTGYAHASWRRSRTRTPRVGTLIPPKRRRTRDWSRPKPWDSGPQRQPANRRPATRGWERPTHRTPCAT